MYSRVGKITRTDLAVTEEALRVVVLEWLQTIWTPEKERDVRDTVTLFRYLKQY